MICITYYFLNIIIIITTHLFSYFNHIFFYYVNRITASQSSVFLTLERKYSSIGGQIKNHLQLLQR